MIGGLNLLGLLFPCVYTEIYTPIGILGCQGDLIVKVAIIWSGIRCSVALKTKGGHSLLLCTGGRSFPPRRRNKGGRAAHVSYPQRVSAPSGIFTFHS